MALNVANPPQSKNLTALLDEVEVALVNVRADIARSESGFQPLTDPTKGLRIAEQALLRSMDWLRYTKSEPAEYSR